MWEPHPLTALRASVACTGITLPLTLYESKYLIGRSTKGIDRPLKIPSSNLREKKNIHYIINFKISDVDLQGINSSATLNIAPNYFQLQFTPF
jgi:hypothetical protein